MVLFDEELHTTNLVVTLRKFEGRQTLTESRDERRFELLSAVVRDETGATEKWYSMVCSPAAGS